MDLLKDKVALVTGSSRGIGAAVAQLFASEGAKVAVHGRDTAAVSAVKGGIERAGGCAISILGDVARFDEVETMRNQIENLFGPIDILVANAGGSFTQPGPIEEISEEGWRASVEGNLTATFLTIKSVLPGMKQRKTGSIVTISSSAGRKPHPQADTVFRCQGRNPDSHAGRRRAGGTLWHPRELHSAGDNSHRTQPATHTGSTAEIVGGSTSPKAPRHTG